MKTILLIDDCEDFRLTLADILLDHEFDLREAQCPDEAFRILSNEKVDLIICDLHMPFVMGPRAAEFEESHRVGVMTIRELRWVFPGLPIIALSAAPASDLQEYARMLAPVPVGAKPISKGALLGMIDRAFLGEESRVYQ